MDRCIHRQIERERDRDHYNKSYHTKKAHVTPPTMKTMISSGGRRLVPGGGGSVPRCGY